MKTAIIHAWILTMDEVFHEYKDGTLIFEDSIITYVGEACELPSDVDQMIDAAGNIVLPGMINTHAHVAMIPFRVLHESINTSSQEHVFAIERTCMNESLIYLNARYGILEMQKSGITSFVDMYYHMDQVGNACEELMMRGFLGNTIMDERTCDAANSVEGLVLAEEFLEAWQHSKLVTPMMAVYSPYHCDINILKKAMNLAIEKDIMLNMHVAEEQGDMVMFEKKYKMDVIRWLDEQGILNTHLLAAHVLHVSEHDIQLLSRRKVTIAHCPSANMSLGKGIAAVWDMKTRGVTVSLGTDGYCNETSFDMFTQMRTFAYAQKSKYKDSSIFPAKQIVRMATIGGAEALHVDHAIGSLVVGKYADLVIVDALSFAMFPMHDPYMALVYRATPHDVRDVFIHGSQVVSNHQSCFHEHTIRHELEVELQDFNEQAMQYEI